MKRVCHVTSAHRRYDTRIFQKECMTLVKEGYEITLLVIDEKKDEEINGIRIITAGFVPKNRRERFIEGNKRIMRRAIEIDADIYHLHDPDLLFLGLKLKKRGKRVIFDSHENVREDIKDKDYIPKFLRGFVSKIYAAFEEYILKHIDAVIGVTPEQMELLEKIGNKATMITNFPEFANETDNKSIQKNGICFAGGINSYWSHEKILDILSEVNVKYKICGVTEEAYFQQLEKHKNWKYVEYFGIIKHEEVLGFLKGSIAGMALLKPMHNLGKEGTLGNTKIFEYMRAGIPIIATNFALWDRIITKYRCGICVDINNETEIVKAVQYLCNNPDEAKRMGENGKKAFLEKYNWETQIPALIQLYNSLLD